MADNTPKARIIKVSNKLQDKIGAGEVARERIESTQAALENTDVDFEPMAAGFLGNLNAAITQAKKLLGKSEDKSLLHVMAKPVMDLKANAQMFGYPLITALANVMLNFLESVGSVDNDVVAIVEAHHKTLNLIIKMKMSGAVDDKGRVLVKELENACERYFASIEQKKS